MASVAISRRELHAVQLRAEAGRSSDPRQTRRILAIAMVVDGHSRLLAAQAGGMDRQTLRDWVHRYNAEGLAGLLDRPRTGRKPRLTGEQLREIEAWVKAGPDREKDGVVRWRCADLRNRIKDRFEIALHERSVGKLLKKLDLSSMSGRPQHPQSDPQAQETFKKTLLNWPVPRSRRSAPDARSKSGSKMKPGSASKAR